MGKKVRTGVPLRLFGGAVSVSSYGAKNDSFFLGPLNATGLTLAIVSSASLHQAGQ